MAKYTIISLILTDFVTIFFIFNLFQTKFRGSFRLNKIPSTKLIFFWGGGVNPFQKSRKFKKVPTALWGAGGHVEIWNILSLFYNPSLSANAAKCCGTNTHYMDQFKKSMQKISVNMLKTLVNLQNIPVNLQKFGSR